MAETGKLDFIINSLLDDNDKLLKQLSEQVIKGIYTAHGCSSCEYPFYFMFQRMRLMPRLREWTPPELKVKKGYLSNYSRLA